jgi:hypothetical protein
LDEAIVELERRAALPRDEPPNAAPCSNWKNCGRNYEVVEYDTSEKPWKELRRLTMLEISADGVKWNRPVPQQKPGR